MNAIEAAIVLEEARMKVVSIILSLVVCFEVAQASQEREQYGNSREIVVRPGASFTVVELDPGSMLEQYEITGQELSKEEFSIFDYNTLKRLQESERHFEHDKHNFLRNLWVNFLLVYRTNQIYGEKLQNPMEYEINEFFIRFAMLSANRKTAIHLLSKDSDNSQLKMMLKCIDDHEAYLWNLVNDSDKKNYLNHADRIKQKLQAAANE